LLVVVVVVPLRQHQLGVVALVVALVDSKQVRLMYFRQLPTLSPLVPVEPVR
jgi:hypothetical protein